MKIYLGSLVVILIATTISSSDISPSLIEECRKDGEVARWGGDWSCDEACDSPPRRSCHNALVLRCFCPEGKVRIKARGRCIPSSECPARNGQKFPSNTSNRGKWPSKDEAVSDPPKPGPMLIEECRKKGEVAKWGDPKCCDETCAGKKSCPNMLGTLRCFCPEGKVRSKLGGRCIPRSQCQEQEGQKWQYKASNRDVSPALIEECRKKGEVARFGPDEDCDVTCEGPPRTCRLIGMTRCFCPNGKVRITNRGRCIPPSECPARNGQKFRSNTFNRG